MQCARNVTFVHRDGPGNSQGQIDPQRWQRARTYQRTPGCSIGRLEATTRVRPWATTPVAQCPAWSRTQSTFFRRSRCCFQKRSLITTTSSLLLPNDFVPPRPLIRSVLGSTPPIWALQRPSLPTQLPGTVGSTSYNIKQHRCSPPRFHPDASHMLSVDHVQSANMAIIHRSLDTKECASRMRRWHQGPTPLRRYE
jgi:hypothetical protein